MKNKIIPIISFIIILLFLSCEKDLPTYLAFEGYQFSSLDPEAGKWKPILLKSANEIIVPTPLGVNSPQYLQELVDLKSRMSQITLEERQQIKYWTNNPIIRWNEIALELIAKYNLIPGPNDDGSYTLPNANNPTATPLFPFAHPPYAVRALAYLSVAQFDGLLSAWYNKYTFNRKTPSSNDLSIINAYEVNNIPSYPSDGAVVASVSKNILMAMLPNEAIYLEERENSHLKSLLLAGSHVKSDIDVGKILGEAVSKIALLRASGDGMRSAQAPRSVADSLAKAAFDRFGWKWMNLEIPQRLVGLAPLYGKVKMWSVDNVESTRPVAPPAIGSDEFKKDVEILIDYSNNVTDERRRIANFWQDGVGTYTPPGHWNQFAKEFIVKYKMNPLRSARTFAYLNMAMMDGGISCWDAKYYYNYPHPIQSIDGFKTILGTPNFPAYTSGHSVFSAAGAEVLAYIFPNEANKVRSWAVEAANSRLYGGIHWTFDAKIGTEQGKVVAQYTINKALVDGAK